MLSSLQKLLTIVFLLLPLICGVKNVYAELSSEEQYQHFKNKRKNIKDRIQFIEESIAHLDVWEKNISKSEYYKRLQERNKFLKELKSLKDEYYNLGSNLQDLFEKKRKLIFRAHIAREYEVGEYEEKLIKAKNYLKKTQMFNEWITNEKSGGNDEIMKNYLMFIIMCDTLADILQSDIGAILRKDFDWKDKDFIWAKDASNSIGPNLVRDMKELLTDGSHSYEKQMFDDIKDGLTGDDWFIKNAPMLCKTIKEVHTIMLPDKRKNIMNRMRSRVKDWFN
ncbi:hypothetical protein [Bartonella queenslandensis]|uniref:hypothetical protein n=1 Tax=Bartonella queenslandensis TaxID=481138 RepID=UPI001BAE48D6|nr:hypothetical protein [Bartonella queenslandensis]